MNADHTANEIQIPLGTDFFWVALVCISLYVLHFTLTNLQQSLENWAGHCFGQEVSHNMLQTLIAEWLTKMFACTSMVEPISCASTEEQSLMTLITGASNKSTSSVINKIQATSSRVIISKRNKQTRKRKTTEKKRKRRGDYPRVYSKYCTFICRAGNDNQIKAKSEV